ncbi:MAG: AI-2E family transporter [Bordetella sp.]|jgi:predicted PurR-regulated permease PerM
MTEILAPFITALLLAYLLEPFASLVTAKGIPRSLSSVVAIALGVLLGIGLVLVAVPIVENELHSLRERFPDAAARLYGLIYPHLVEAGLPVDDSQALKTKIIQWLQGQSSAVSQTVFATLQSGLGMLMALLGWLVLVPVLLFFLIKDWATMWSNALALVPSSKRKEIRETSLEIHLTLQSYLRGQGMLILAMACFYCLGLLITGLSSWFSIGLLSGLLVFVPYLGFSFSLVLAMVSGILELGLMHGLIAIGMVYSLGQFLESFVLTPKLVGEQIGLNPLAVILALMIFGGLLGLIGVLLALPLAACVVVLGRRLIKKLHDEDANASSKD